MAGRRGRHWRTPDEAVATELGYARVLGVESTAERLRHHQRLAAIYRRSIEAWRKLQASAVGRGERWSATYQLRKAERDMAEHEAVVAALTAWLEAQGWHVAAPSLEQAEAVYAAARDLAPDYDAPEGAGEGVEAYRG